MCLSCIVVIRLLTLSFELVSVWNRSVCSFINLIYLSKRVIVIMSVCLVSHISVNLVTLALQMSYQQNLQGLKKT